MSEELKVPSVGESITEVTISSWFKEDGDFVEADEAVCEIESDKASMELPSPASGIVRHKAAEGDTVEIGSVIAAIEPGEGASASKPAASETTESPAAPAASSETTGHGSTSAAGVASPAAQKILREKGVDAGSVNGSGKDGRVTKADALSASAQSTPAGATQAKAAPAAKTSAPTLSVVPGSRNIRREKMSGLRKTISKRLVEAKNITAMLTTFNEVDMSEVMALRKKYKEIFKEKHEIGLGFMSFFTKAACLALQEFPAVNAQIDGTEMVYHDYCDIGIAVSTPRGLVVPNVRNAEVLSLDGIEKAIMDLALRARDNKIGIDEMQGGTFTITNGGIFGSMLSTPIINIPQSAILGMHNIVERPVAVNGEVKIRPVMYLALSYDHRIIDGRESVSFLKKVKEYIEDPARLLLMV